MKLRSPSVWIAVVSGICVLLMAVVDVGRTSPGPLTSVHQRERDLEGRSGCSECHGGWRRSMTRSCLDCHEAIDEQIEGGLGLHGVLDEQQAKLCALCHSEHHGAGFDIVNRASFVNAGIPDPESFDHVLLGFSMEGQHLEQECSACHENAELETLPAGAVRYLGLDRDCATCHEDPHEGRMTIGCASCHGQEDFEELDSFGHEEHLPLIGGHADVGCRDCHGGKSGSSLAALGRGKSRPTARDCQDCHESPHRMPFTRGVAKLLSQAPEASCVTCHEAEHESFREEVLVVTPEHHAQSGFTLAPPHDEAECGDCHASHLPRFRGRYPGRGPDECSKCHDDPHGGQFQFGPFAEVGCVGCHERSHFEPHAFGIEEHELAELPLTGRHVEIECSECHLDPVADLPRTFRGTPIRCDECHDDAHADFFADAPAAESEAPDCGACHGTGSFHGVDEEAFDHGAWTGFEVLGAHAQADCEICHPASEEPDDMGRSFGRVADAFGRFTGCETCHRDPHRGVFDELELPRSIFGKRGCERCHVQTSFRTFPDGFDHRRWTDFPLTGAHGEIGCSDCHRPLRQADLFGRSWAAAAGRDCVDCHDDPHAGQFEQSQGDDCARCHKASKTFADLAFHHEWDSRFQLGDAHRDVACDACHRAEQVGDVVVVRYRPLERDCTSCHGDHDRPMMRRRKRGGR